MAEPEHRPETERLENGDMEGELGSEGSRDFTGVQSLKRFLREKARLPKEVLMLLTG